MNCIDKALHEAESSYTLCAKAVASRASRALASGSPGGSYAPPSSLSKASEQYQHNVGWVYAAVKAVAQKIAEREVFVGKVGSKPTGRKLALPGRLKALGENVEPLQSHALLELLADPCPLLTRWSLFYATIASLELTGRALWWLTADKGKRELWPLPSSWCTPEDPMRGSWKVQPKNSTQEFIVPGDDMVYFALPDPSDPFGCLSPLQSQSLAVATDEAIQSCQYRSFKNGVMPGLLIRAGRHPDTAATVGERPVLTLAQRNELTAMIRAAHQGAINYGEPLIMDALIEGVEKLTYGPAEMDFLGSGETTKSRIFQAFGVSPFAVGQVENGNRAAMTVAQQTLAENVVNPLATLLSESLTAWLGPAFGEGLVVWLDRWLPRDDEIDLQAWKEAMRCSCATRNEFRRRWLNLPDMAGGDEPPNPLDAMFGRRPSDEEKGLDRPLADSWQFDRLALQQAKRKGNGKARAVA